MLLFRDLQYYFFFLLFSYLEKFLGIGKDSPENVQKLQMDEGWDFLDITQWPFFKFNESSSVLHFFKYGISFLTY